MGLAFARQATDSLQYRPGAPNRTVMMRRLHDARPRLLLVEDDDVLRALYGGILGNAFAVDAAASLGAARESLARQSPDLIIADLHLGDGKGNETVAGLAPSKDRALAPLIILTADRRPAVKTALAREGVDATLHKPVTPAELVAAARGALARSARQQASALARLGALLNHDGTPPAAALASGWRMARATVSRLRADMAATTLCPVALWIAAMVAKPSPITSGPADGLPSCTSAPCDQNTPSVRPPDRNSLRPSG